ncbi:PE domain-containing protein [Actinophytocola algeriensis]|uniref:PE domain-containing protein n=1 Tax=Actinophytocola algeriensis TaxID=1768010 RepID=A0A7W7VE18_9PSEU|nr:PE domain-containing protein [Actinophytocola algeriensis]MBB4906570.1 hypothetical protein [Actinophytocola algeriensis]MBE1478051.1 hypothetical protein [Actinophytocola algeriensis]
MAGELHKGEGLREIANAAQARGSFSFDPDELRSLIRKWQDLADSYADSISQAERMALIKPPGHDFASEAHASAANGSGASYLAYLTHNARYCDEQAHLFQAALNDYLGVEDTNATEFDKNDRKV